jgi:hypothetical protein
VVDGAVLIEDEVAVVVLELLVPVMVGFEREGEYW